MFFESINSEGYTGLDISEKMAMSLQIVTLNGVTIKQQQYYLLASLVMPSVVLITTKD